MEDGTVACSLAPGDLAGRRERWLRLSERARLEKKPIPGGVRLRFRTVAGVEGELRELAELERDCCSFAAWSVTSEGPDLTLEVIAEGDGVAAVRALSTSPRSLPPAAGERQAELRPPSAAPDPRNPGRPGSGHGDDAIAGSPALERPASKDLRSALPARR